MTAENEHNTPVKGPITLSPWLVVAGALVLYGLTLNHWVSLRAMSMMAQVTGWDWHPYPMDWRPEIMAPLFLVVTAPVRLLPALWQPLALNLLTAVCAALTLGLLARSVRLLPHEHTREQRKREGGAHGLLSIRPAFLPALFAVLLLGTQMAFWQNAVAATGEMLNLLVFAFVVDCLLEYRVSQNDSWLLWSAFVYGLGITNNWAMTGFFVLYIIALAWIKGLFGFFNARFLGRMFLCGLAGVQLYLLIPILSSAHHGTQSFWVLYHRQLSAQLFSLRLVPGWLALLAAVPWILPLGFASINWPAFEGELSGLGDRLTRFMFIFLHVACLVLALVTFFDFKYSPSVRMRELPVSFLTFYYLGALCVGYFSGYMLLLFNPVRRQLWQRRNPMLNILDLCLFELVWVITLAAPAVLVWQNYPHIRAANSRTLDQFADQTLAGLPAKKTIVLSDDAARLYLLQAEFERRGVADKHILIDTESFPHREYIYHLVSQYPELKSVITTNLAHLPQVLGADKLVTFLYRVTQDYPVYYLHPSFGYYFEALYLKPHGLVYELKPYTNNMTQPPLATDPEIKDNQAFWAKMENGPLKTLPDVAKLDTEAEAASVDYAVALDYWGTELQKANHLKEAHDQFAEAVRINPYNAIAAINLQYNERLQKGDHRPIDSRDAIEKAIYMYRGLNPFLRSSGPSDEPGLDLILGQVMAQSHNLFQASILFQRRLQLLPGDAEAQMAMAKTYVDLRQPAKALELIRKLRSTSKIADWQLTRCEAVAYMDSKDYDMAEQLLRKAIQADPKDPGRVGTLADFYRAQAIDCLREHKDAEAALAFTNALAKINEQLRLLAYSSHETFDATDTLLRKADVEMMLHAYGAAVSTLSQVLVVQPKNYTALLNRATSEIEIKRFQAAKDDLKEIGKLRPRLMYLVEFGLADVAASEKNTTEEVIHLKRCVRDAPKESSEYARATNRLTVLARQ